MEVSLTTPNARITINNGIGIRTFGIFTTICPFVNFGDGDTIRTDIVRTGFDASSDTERMSTL